jgi:hypothetical protein
MEIQSRDRSAAAEEIRFVVGLFLLASRNRKTAPRRGDVRMRLQKLAIAADGLTAQLLDLDHFSLDCLARWSESRGAGAPSIHEVSKIAEGDTQRSQYLSFLKGLSRVARDFVTEIGQDSGGEGSLWPDVPEEVLINGCLSIVEQYGGKMPFSTTEGGPTRELVSLVHEIATGIPKDLEHFVKKVLKRSIP